MTRGSETANRLSYSLKASAPKDVRDRALKEIASALQRHAGNVSETAEDLGVGRVTLHRWIAEHSYLRKSVDSARVRGPG
jgi:transcriptional regulator of acetoin/glycerol metabolism